MEEKEFDIKVTVYATKTVNVEASSFEEACEKAELKMNNQIYNYRVDFSYEFEHAEKAEKNTDCMYYDDSDYNYRYEHEFQDDDDDIYENYN